MLVRIVLLFFTSSVCAAENVNQYSSNQQGYVYEPQRCLGGYCSQRPQFPASFTVPGYPQYFQSQDSSYRNIQQADRRTFLHNNPQLYANQPQQYVNELQQYVNQQQRQYVQQQAQFVNQQQQNANQQLQYVNQPQANLNQQNRQYAYQPQPYDNQRQQNVNQLQQNVNQQQRQFLNQQKQYVNQQPKCVDQHQLNLNQQQQYNNHQHWQYQNQHQQYGNQPQQNVYQSQGNENRPQENVNQYQENVNQPQQNANQPQKKINQPQQNVYQPQENTFEYMPPIFVPYSPTNNTQPQQNVNQPQQNENQPRQNVNQQQQFVNQQQLYANQQPQYVTQPQQPALGYFYDKPTSPPTSPTSPPTSPTSSPTSSFAAASILSAPAFIQSTDYSAASRISEKKCYQRYFPDAVVAVAGGDKADDGEFPYMAAIGYSKPTGGYDYQCGGTLISSNFILTAAHCRTANGQRPAVVRIGGARLDDNAPQNQPQEITDVIIHPDYRRRQVYNDIALLKLKDAASNVDPACLWTQNDINYNTATAIGYGQTAFGLSTSTDLLKVDLQLYSNQVCQAYYTPRFRIERGLIGSQVCAGDFNKVKDTCPGDSGGPLLARTEVRDKEVPFILGVTSFGPGCAEGTPGVYTKVASYLDWLEPIVWPAE